MPTPTLHVGSWFEDHKAGRLRIGSLWLLARISPEPWITPGILYVRNKQDVHSLLIVRGAGDLS